MFRRSVQLAVGVLALAILGSLVACSPVANEEARARVQDVLAQMQNEGNTMSVQSQTAMCRFYNGAVALDQTSQSIASDHFTQWLNKKEINRKIQSFEIESVKSDGSGANAASIVRVKIEGRSLGIRVAKGEEMTWVD